MSEYCTRKKISKKQIFFTASQEIMYNWFIWKLKKYIMPCILQALDCLRMPTIAVHFSCAHEKTSFQTGLQSATTRFELFHWVWNTMIFTNTKNKSSFILTCKQERSILYISFNVYALSFLNVKGIELHLWCSKRESMLWRVKTS